MKRQKVSVVIITKNEERNIEECLQSVAWADEIIVVDSGSEDKTVDICEKFGAKILQHPIDKGLNFNKNLGNDAASGDWILSLDADERVSPELAEEVKNSLIRPVEYAGFLVPRKNYFLGQWIKGAGWWPNAIIRFFQKGKGKWPPGVHEVVRADGPVGTFKGALLHYSYRSFQDYIRKFHYYTTTLAGEELSKGKKITFFSAIWYFFLNPFQVIFRKYIFMCGWRDGAKGLFISVSAGMTVLVMAFKMWGFQLDKKS